MHRWCRRRVWKRTTESFDVAKIHAKSVKIWAKSLKTFTKSLKILVNPWKYEQKWHPKESEEIFVGGRRFFSGKFGRIRAKILRIPKNLPLPCCTTTDLWIFWYCSKDFWSCICESPVPNVHMWKIWSARCEWPLAAGWTNSLLC